MTPMAAVNTVDDCPLLALMTGSNGSIVLKKSLGNISSD
jgi:hypothetical protein